MIDTPTIHILLVEDNPGDVRLLEELLHENGTQLFSIEHVDSICQALSCAANKNFDLLLLDLALPDSSGLDTVRKMYGAIPHTPIIVLTNLEDDGLAVETVQAGAQDYLLKNQINAPALVRAMRHAIERKKTEEGLHFIATHDNLTALPNRLLFQDRLAHSIERARRNNQGAGPQTKITVILMDVDNFKTINDTFGHPQGDLILQAVAKRLREAIRQSDTVARMGGDEFMLFFESDTDLEDAEILGKKILAAFKQPFPLAGQELQVTASLGISVYPDDGQDFQTLMQSADIAMYHAKRERNRFCLYRSGGEG